MSRPYVGPMTEQICDTENNTQPPALIREWAQAVKNPGEEVFLWAGAALSKSAAYSWLSIVEGTTDEGDAMGGKEGSERESTVVKTPPEHIERLLTPLAHTSRIRIMQALYDAPLSATELSEAVGARGGSLYHHLRDLKYAAYLTDGGGRYALTDLGRQMLVTAALIANQTIVDRGEEGLGVGTYTAPEEASEEAS